MIIEDFIDSFQYSFMQNMYIAALLASIACGIIGTYVVVKRLVFISGGIAHTSFGGVGLGYYLAIEPMLGAVIFSVGAALMVGITSLRTKIREDSTIGVLWVIGMALGVIFIRMTPGYVPDPMAILFGNILLVKTADLWLMAGLVIVILVIVSFLFKEFQAMSFDEEFAKISGVRTGGLYILLLCLVALTVVLLIKVVGVVLVIALLTIPAALAGLVTYNMKKMMGLAIVIGIVLSLVGIMLSWVYDLPPGATIILVAGVVFLVALALDHVRKMFRHAEKGLEGSAGA